jgi:dephospho-CoA kinase
VFAGKPIIGLAGGIGSGKSTVARLFGEMGCLVLSADEAVADAYRDPAVKSTLREWWGDEVFDNRGEVERRALGRIVFENPEAKRRLEGLIHPLVARQRQRAMEVAAGDAQVIAYVWDIPLLFEVGLDRQCDAIVFVEAPFEDRLRRVRAGRGWDDVELVRREKLQQPLDNKREMSNYIVQNTADVGFARKQVRDVLCAILAGQSGR